MSYYGKNEKIVYRGESPEIVASRGREWSWSTAEEHISKHKVLGRAKASHLWPLQSRLMPLRLHLISSSSSMRHFVYFPCMCLATTLPFNSQKPQKLHLWHMPYQQNSNSNLYNPQMAQRPVLRAEVYALAMRASQNRKIGRA